MKNAIFKELLQLHHEGGVALGLEAPPLHVKEPLDFVREVQEDWEAKVRRGINTLCTEKGVVLAREVGGQFLLDKGSSLISDLSVTTNFLMLQQRTLVEKETMIKRWNSIGADFPGIHTQIKYIHTE